MISCGVDPGKHCACSAIGDSDAPPGYLTELVGSAVLLVDIDTHAGRIEGARKVIAWALRNSAEVVAIEWVEDLFGDSGAHTHVMRAQELATLVAVEAEAAGLRVVTMRRQTALAYVRRVASKVPGCPPVPAVVERGSAQLEPALRALVAGWADREREREDAGNEEHEADACAVALAEAAQRAGIRLPATAKSRAARRSARRAMPAGPPRPAACGMTPERQAAALKVARAALRAAAGCVCKPGGGHAQGCALYVAPVKWSAERARAEATAARRERAERSGEG